MENTIKVIAHHYASFRDLNGNCYWFSRITNTANGKSFTFTTPHKSNTESFLFKLGFEWSNIYCVEQWEKIREYNRLEKNMVEDHNSCKSQSIMDKLAKIFELETVPA